jgi:hypothetical protein
MFGNELKNIVGKIDLEIIACMHREIGQKIQSQTFDNKLQK